MLGHVGLLGLEHLISSIPHGPGHPHGAVIPQVAADLSHDHGHTVGGELHIQRGVEVVDGFDEANTAHLKQIVHVLSPVGKLVDHRQHQPQVPGNELLPGLLVPLFGPAQQGLGLLILQHLQLGGIHPAQLYLIQHVQNLPPVTGCDRPDGRPQKTSCPGILCHSVSPGQEVSYFWRMWDIFYRLTTFDGLFHPWSRINSSPNTSPRPVSIKPKAREWTKPTERLGSSE